MIKKTTFQAGKKEHWGNALASGAALTIIEIAKQQNHPILLITAGARETNQLAHALKFFNTDTNPLPILEFPGWETLPYERFSPHQDIISERLLTLYRLQNLRQGIIVVPIQTLMQRISPTEYVTKQSFIAKQGDALDLTAFRTRLQQNNYQCVSQVVVPGEFAVRGAILDIFPSGSHQPYRIDLFDNEIDSIRAFDPETQRSTEKYERIELLPAREYPLTEKAITIFRQQWRELFSVNTNDCAVYTTLSNGTPPPGIEYFLPLFFEKLATLLDYIPKESLLIHSTATSESAEKFWHEIHSRYENLKHDITYPIMPPETLWLQPNELFTALREYPQLQLQKEATKQFNLPFAPIPDLPINHQLKQPLVNLQNFLASTAKRVLFCVETTGRREFLLELLAEHNIRPTPCENWTAFIKGDAKLAIAIGGLDQGLNLQEPDVTVITETQLFGEQVMQRRQRKSRTGMEADTVVKNLIELTINAPVVHIDHGVGRYLGLQTLTIDNVPTEFITLEYAGGDKLYLPVTHLHLISRYTGTDEQSTPLHSLKSNQWEKAKRKAAEQIRDTAAELLAIYAKRQARVGHAFPALGNDYYNFASAFPFEETPDQARAIDDVINDMLAVKPMDRLVCGDVGFGKTEVAMRAAFIAVQGNKQVAILVPTTLLAQQHFDTFSNRFADFPIKVELLSRFRTAKQQQQSMEALAEGKADIIIGTHKLLQKDIRFKSLGLVIIDEEHRFGVQQKERFKALRAEVDILTLTATPIPRTLNMALAKIRDLSLITTPPAKRLAIKTFVRERENQLIREAILRELMRGGQVYFLHNNVQTIAKIAQDLATLIPEARVNIAHGQMHERELEKIMIDFYHQRFNVLVCTTIIETGIDIPTANTIIIDRADKLGLAQMHQLRGRVGRSHHQAYAYLLIPGKKLITTDAEKRLEAIETLEDLGAGFLLANHDLEIRGAGELLGEGQSGQIQTIGFHLYMDLLDQAVKALESGETFDLEASTHKTIEINLNIPALIPEDYLADVQQRLVLYKRIANAKDKDQLKNLEIEMIDRFGLLPDATKRLFLIAQLKLNAQKIGIEKIDGNRQYAIITFKEKPNIESIKIIQLIQQKPKEFQLAGTYKLKCLFQDESYDARLQTLQAVIVELQK